MNGQNQHQAVPASQKTPDQRKAELSAQLQALGASMPSTPEAVAVPAEIVKIIDILKGQQVRLGDIEIDALPTVEGWKEATTKQGKKIYVALDTFGLRDLVAIGKHKVCAKISIVIKSI